LTLPADNGWDGILCLTGIRNVKLVKKLYKITRDIWIQNWHPKLAQVQTTRTTGWLRTCRKFDRHRMLQDAMPNVTVCCQQLRHPSFTTLRASAIEFKMSEDKLRTDTKSFIYQNAQWILYLLFTNKVFYLPNDAQ
jgi:hypothetical protein